MSLINSYTFLHRSIIWMHRVYRVLLVIWVCIYPICIVSNRNTARVLTEHIVGQSVYIRTILVARWIYIARRNLLIHIIVVSSLWEWTLIFHPTFLCTKFCIALLFLFNWCISLVINIFQRLFHHLHFLLKLINWLFYWVILLYSAPTILLIEKALSCWHS